MNSYKTLVEYIKLAGYKVISFDKIPSTQTHALELVARGDAGANTVVVAAAQSAGRGRYRRKWVSHHGNIYASFIFDAPQRDARLSYMVAVAVAETLIQIGITPQIKWPNDILIDGKKVAGILIEYAGSFVVVGIGINIKTNPTVDEYKTTKTENYVTASQNDIMNKLMRNLDRWRRMDFEIVRARWMSLAVGLNRMVKYQGALVELIGINDMGALVLRRGTGYLLAYGDEIIMQ